MRSAAQRRWPVVLAGLALVATACSDGAPTAATVEEVGGGRDTTASPVPPATATPTPTPAPTPTPTPSPAPTAPVTLAFGGDVHFEGMLDAKVREDPEGMLAAIAPVLSAADVAVVNLETAVTEGGSPSPKEYNFAAPATAYTALDAAGIDLASLANNHGMDFGAEGLEDTLASAEAADFPLVGAGRDEDEAYAPWTTTVHGRRIGIIGATQVLDTFALDAWVAGPDTPGLASAKENGVERLLASVEQTAAEVDTTVVFLHWGAEGEQCPLPRQPELAGQLVDAGADVIVGGHAHRLQGGGFLDDAFVSYGLGNFVFYSSGGPATHSGVITVTIAPDDTLDAEFLPATIRSGVPVPLEGGEAEARRADWESLRDCTGLASTSASTDAASA